MSHEKAHNNPKSDTIVPVLTSMKIFGNKTTKHDLSATIQAIMFEILRGKIKTYSYDQVISLRQDVLQIEPSHLFVVTLLSIVKVQTEPWQQPYHTPGQ